MADEEAVLEEGIRAAQSPLVQVSFQRNVNRKQKYLEAEPKLLGVTQIGLSAYQILCVSVFLANDLSQISTDIPFFVASLLIVIAGSVAVAAQNLHLPTLRACLGMQIVACGASIFNMVCTLIRMDMMYYYCWHYDYDNSTLHIGEICHKIENAQSHFSAEVLVIQVTLLAISVTLAAYCCKVVNCCSPAPKVPVITVQAPPVQQ
ncbi:membrane-spanning 4-domains subfamily A member 4A-like [Tautogolabrus adspersus]